MPRRETFELELSELQLDNLKYCIISEIVTLENYQNEREEGTLRWRQTRDKMERLRDVYQQLQDEEGIPLTIDF